MSVTSVSICARARRRRGAEIAAAAAAAALAALAVAGLLAWALVATVPAAWADETQPSEETAASPEGGVAPSVAPDDAENDADASTSSASKTGEQAVELDGASNLVDPTQRADNSFLYDTTVESLFNQASLYDGNIVQVSGEAIGDIVTESLRGKRCWITLTSTDAGNPSTISVLLSKDQARQVDHLGRYGVTGTTLQVRGVYHQACVEHEGIPDIHATTVAVVARGSEHPDKFALEDFMPGFVTIGIGLLLMGVYVFVRERSR